MAKTVVLNWVNPTTRGGGAVPLAPTELAYTEVFLSADQGATFVSVAQVASPVSVFTQTGLEPGTYIFGLEEVDTQTPPKRSARVLETVVVPADALAAPDPVTGVTFVVQ